MGRARDPNRNKAFEIYKEHDGKIDLAEIASQLNISPGTVRGWKSKDSWDKAEWNVPKSMERSKNKKVEEKRRLKETLNRL
ncbi:MAG: phage terminase small subunit-related protein [Blautia sp.]